MEVRRLRADELEQAWELDQESFHSPDGRREGFMRWDAERLVGAFDGERLVAISGAIGFGQFFGGRPVPMGGLSSVAVAADRRGEGLGQRVVSVCLEDMRSRGDAISSLYPATTEFYRRLGWELAGGVAWRSVEPERLARLPRAEAVELRPAEDSDVEAIRACYAAYARDVNGLLDRPELWWQLREARRAADSTYVAVDLEGEVAGYLAYERRDGALGPGGPFCLAVNEFVWRTRDAGLALWRLLASWSTQVEKIFTVGPVEDPACLILPEQVSETMVELRWMLRVVDAEAAIDARGFPTGLTLDVPFEVDDTELPANAGRYVLRVDKGRGTLEPGGPGGAALDVGAFSSLYAGFSSTADLARAGRLAGGSEEQRAGLDAAFAGPTPALLDQF
jgi:predicted acetyltransferase